MLKIGADPEMFLMDASQALVSAIEKIGGSKENPLPLPIGDGYAVQEDNVAIEYNIPPAESADELVRNINSAKAFLLEWVQTMGLQFSRLSAAEFPAKELAHPLAKVFGCDPDYNAWTGKVNPRPKADNAALRSCGGHVHIGHPFKSNKDRFKFIQYCDLYLGVGSVLMDEGELRKSLYGAAGACRPKPYGVEYRTLSNFWTFDDDLIKWVYNNTALAMTAWQEKQNIADVSKLIQVAINNNNKSIARELINEFNIPLA